VKLTNGSQSRLVIKKTLDSFHKIFRFLVGTGFEEAKQHDMYSFGVAAREIFGPLDRKKMFMLVLIG